MDDYFDLEEYFEEHPDEEDEFIDELARMDAEKEFVEYPEEWPEPDWLKYA